MRAPAQCVDEGSGSDVRIMGSGSGVAEKASTHDTDSGEDYEVPLQLRGGTPLLPLPLGGGTEGTTTTARTASDSYIDLCRAPYVLYVLNVLT